MKTAEHITVGIRHPLDPLTAGEIETVSQILKRDRGLADSARFVYITLREPAKDAVLNYLDFRSYAAAASQAARTARICAGVG